MKFIEQSFELIDEPDPLKKIEIAGRTCYKSENKITQDSAKKFVQMLVKRGHLSVIEHATAGYWIGPWQLDKILTDDLPRFLNITNHFENGDSIISGNLRAFKELIEVRQNDGTGPLYQKLKTDFPWLEIDVSRNFHNWFTTGHYVSHIDGLTETDLAEMGLWTAAKHTYQTVKFITNRGVTHELVRHRPASYCLSGDTKILRYDQGREHLTIKELYERQLNPQLNGRNKLMRLRSMTPNGMIVKNKIKKVIKSGIKKVYRVKTENGYEIKSSENHIFFSPTGQHKLKNLNVGDKVFVNGLPSTNICEFWLRMQYNELSRPIQDIANEAGCSYSTVRKYLAKYGLTKHHGAKPSSFAPWNKGLRECNDPRVKKQAEALRKNHHNNSHGITSSNWKGNKIKSLSGKRLRFSKYDKQFCYYCGTVKGLENHYKDENPNNWHEDNKQTLCRSCHKLTHHGYNVKKATPMKIALIEYAGHEMTYDIEMEEPYHNFVANGFVVHNSQESTRYVNYGGPEMQFIKPVWIKRSCEKMNDPDSGFETDQEQTLHEALDFSEEFYKSLLIQGWRPEQAREVLPNALKTEIVMTCNLMEWRHVFKMRCQKAAHPQIRDLMLSVLGAFKAKYTGIFNDLEFV
jgi:thymidylate synthase ThyX